MDLYDALVTRRTIQTFRASDVAWETVERALAAAHQAPCHKLTWPWRFTVLGRETREALVPRAIELKAKGREPSEKLCGAIRAKILNPAHCIVVSQRRTDDAFRAREDYAAVSCAIQNLSLALHAEGVGSKWGSGAITRDPLAYEVCGIDPEAEEIVGFIWVGEAAAVPNVSRPPLADFVRRLP